jgi:N-glycosidase YbiA
MTHPQPKAPSVSEAYPADSLNGLDTPTRVRFYEHDFYPLSNFSAFAIKFGNMLHPTSEAAYHWQKFTNAPGVQRLLFDTLSAHDAFKVAEMHKGKRRKDWDAVKVPIMKDILRAKAAQHEYVRRKLLATGDRELVEDSWRDDFWGWGPNHDGQNMLGKLWMEVRAEIAEAAA